MADQHTEHRTDEGTLYLGSIQDVFSMRIVGYSILQKNVLDRTRWKTHEELRIAIITWTERKYHRGRRQARLGRLRPSSTRSP
ncbi:hypothetical protein HDA30_000291 [Micrococcus cohnii]|uniref:Integrase catalytic domain-containing protein n=1 Tax=Micrococcus cohnii TaxID=993416 RepID=A0A7W7GMD3_9MICC|nr:hypothetical protein [Micrococcus cohnii]